MFGPNKHIRASCEVTRSHRDASFLADFVFARRLFAEKFNLGDYDILFIPGPGTMAMETVLATCRERPRIIGAEGTFRQRWRDVIAAPGRGYADLRPGPSVVCRLETSRSLVNHGAADIVDAVSSFPFYAIGDCKVFVTAINKQLGMLPGFSVVGVHKQTGWDLMRPSGQGYSLLDLNQYHRDGPVTTFPLHLIPHFIELTDAFDVAGERTEIEDHSRCVVDAVGSDWIVGEDRCPVITIADATFSDDFVQRWELYRSAYGRQIFTYSCSDIDYHRFEMECRAAATRGKRTPTRIPHLRSLATGTTND